MRKVLFSLIVLCCASGPVCGEQWHQFRGPGGSGRSATDAVPVRWGESEHEKIAWKTELPGAGTSSPIVVGERIYVTCYSGYGFDPAAPGQMDKLRRHLVCLDRATGEILWQRVFEPRLPESEYSGGNNSRHGYSSSTPATDGERLYVFFGKTGVFCLDLEGNTLWQQTVGDRATGWGSSNSPRLYQNLVIINASVESGRLLALDKETGREVWSASGIRSSWNTPAIVSLPDGEDEVVVSVQGWLLAYDPTTGEELWRSEGIPTYVCPSVISQDGVVYATGGRGTQYTLAVRAGGRGNVTDTHQLWRVAKGSNVSSPVYHDGHLYLVNDSRGIAFCFDAETGKIVYEKRLTPRPGLMYASPLFAGGNIYYVSQHEGTYVVAAGPEFELVALNRLAEDDVRSNTGPVVDDGQLLFRNDRFLYRVGNP